MSKQFRTLVVQCAGAPSFRTYIILLDGLLVQLVLNQVAPAEGMWGTSVRLDGLAKDTGQLSIRG